MTERHDRAAMTENSPASAGGPPRKTAGADAGSGSGIRRFGLSIKPLAAGALCVAVAWLGLATPSQAEEFVESRLEGPFRILDGDTFETDLNGDGEIQLPRERIRLLYVDTPELGESYKGTDRVRGLMAKALLESALRKTPVVLAVPVLDNRGKFGRTLGLLRTGRSEVNLQLIREGLSYFDTRFVFPADYDRYAEAEGLAFSEGKGIWSDLESRESYLRRLARERKTPRSPDNPRFAGTFDAERFDPRAFMRRYVRVRGRLIWVNGMNQRFIRFRLDGGVGRPPIHGVAFHPYGKRLRITRWPPGSTVIMEGFVEGYRNRPNIILHYGAVVPSMAALR